MTELRTVASALADALDAYERLAGLGEEVEDEWTYVTDLAVVWRTALETEASGRGDDALPASGWVAIERAIEEVDRIADPHRAIDWLSTFPQVVLLALEARG